MVKIIIGIAVVVIMAVAGTVYFMWNKPHPSAAKGSAIELKADDLYKEYSKDEKAADAKYLNKKIEVTGVVGETEKNQDGGVMAVL